MSAGRVVIAGGNGFLGQCLAGPLNAAGYEVELLARQHRSRLIGAQHIWDGKTGGPWEERLDGARAVINLAGRSVNCRYTPANRAEILSSRVDSVQAIAAAIGQAARPPSVWVQASSLAIYGDAGSEVCDESHPADSGFSPDVIVAWEAAIAAADVPRTRRVILRTSFVLDPRGGSLPTLARLVRFGLGGRVGTGQQWVSWIHAADFVKVVFHALDTDTAAGIYNVTAPEPVHNAELMKDLRHALHRTWSPPVPIWALRIGAWMLRTEPELVLKSRKAVPARLLEEGFRFRFPTLRDAFADLL